LNKSDDVPGTYQLSLVNTSGSSMRPYRDLIPVQNITVELPFAIKSVEILYSTEDRPAKFRENTITIDNLEEFYSLKIISK
jgi:hypothetical protein